MKELSFVDTNILVYAYDIDSGNKHKLALNLIDSLWANRDGVLSTQVLCEFFVTVTRKIPNPISIDYARQIIKDYISSWKTIVITSDILLLAIDILKEHHFSFWDALICATARYSGAVRIFTEDFQHKNTIDSIEFVNPFLL